MDDNTVKKVIIQPGCITCGLCEYAAPEVFEVTDISHVKKDADLIKNAACIKQAAAECPVNVIEYEE
jgi:ferredoxin